MQRIIGLQQNKDKQYKNFVLSSQVYIYIKL